jgi:hypothetical protein
MVIGFLLVVTSLPAILLLAFLSPDISNIPLAALCAVPVGPALSAAIYALHHRRRDLTELRPSRQFFHAYRLNVRAVAPVWVIGLAWLSIVGLSLANFWVSGVPGWWAALLIVVGTVAALWTTNALVIASLFDFRLRDLVRLAWEMIPRAPRSTLGNVGVILAAALFAYFTSDLLLIVLSVLFVNVLVVTSRPMVDLVAADYTR